MSTTLEEVPLGLSTFSLRELVTVTFGGTSSEYPDQIRGFGKIAPDETKPYVHNAFKRLPQPVDPKNVAYVWGEGRAKALIPNRATLRLTLDSAINPHEAQANLVDIFTQKGAKDIASEIGSSPLVTGATDVVIHMPLTYWETGLEVAENLERHLV